MSQILLDDLKKSTERGQAVFVIGAGVSMAATKLAQCASWTGLLKHGARRCEELFADLPQGWGDRVRGEIASGDLGELLSAAEKVSDRLGAPKGGEWRRWLRESVGALRAEERSVLDALARLDVPLATTNYDSLLTDVTGRPPVTWKDPARVERVIRGDDEGILHLHGHWKSPSSVILGIRSYERVLGDEHGQTVLRALSVRNTLVFVGFGAGLSDPNFGALLNWIARVRSTSEYRAFRLCRESEVNSIQAQHARDQRIFALSYGPDHNDLAGFLRDLAPSGAAQRPASGLSGTARPHLPPVPNCFGRKDQIESLVAGLLAANPQPAVVLGGPGIGKTAVTQVVVNDERIEEHFGPRRYFVRCDAAKSCDQLVAAVHTTLGLPAASTREALFPAILGFLEAGPVLLILDNLETPWEAEPQQVQELLGVLARSCGGALIASIRGQQWPLGVSWREPVTLDPLEEPRAREAFLAIAGKKFENDPRLPGICGVLDGVPLAITLMAHEAQAEPNLEGLWQRWQDERTAMLRRMGGEDRLSNLEVSYEISIQGKRMDSESRRLLSALSLLPNGIAHQDIADIAPEGLRASSRLRQAGLAFDDKDRLRVLAPLREYVATKYPPDEETRSRVINHFVDLVLGYADLLGRERGAEAVERLVPEVPHVEALLPEALESEEPDKAIRAAKDWGEFVRFTGMGSPRPLEIAVRSAEAHGLHQRQADCIQRLGDIALARSDHGEARRRYEEALPLFGKVGDILGEANCILSLGDIALDRSDHGEARRRYEEALPLFGKVGDILGEANCIQRLGDIALDRSDHGEARRRYEEALPLFGKVGDILGEANCIKRLGDIALARSDHGEARRRYEEALPLFGKVGDILGEANCIQRLGDIALAHSDEEEARRRFETALELYQRIVEPYSIGWAHRRLARIAEEVEDRRKHVEAAREAWQSIDRPDLVASLERELTAVKSSKMNRFLVVGGVLSLMASLLHVAIIFGGADWYRFFCAPERMATLAEHGSILPTMSTSGIATALFLWALYAFSGAGLIRRLPLLKAALALIASVYLIRGLALFPLLVLKPEFVNNVILWSSIICMVCGASHAIGAYQVWSRI